MSRCVITILLLMVPFMTAIGQDGPGRWTGAIVLPGVELAINVTLTSTGTGSTIDIPPQGAFSLPLSNVRLTDSAVYFELPAGPGLAVFESTLVSEARIEGTFKQGAAAGTFFLTPDTEAPADSAHAPEEEVTLETETGRLHGSLVKPVGISTPALVILHSGSGPTNRDGNTQGAGAGNNSLRLLSDALYEAGVAVLRFDKRGVGASVAAGMNEADLRFEAYVSDLVGWIRHFSESSDAFSKVVLAGHSEGGLIATLAATRTDIDGLVLIAAPGRPAGEVLREQLSRNLSPGLYASATPIISALEDGRTADVSDPQLSALFRPSVQPYLISWFALDPAEAFAAVDVPSLILQGTTDLQVPVSDARILEAAQPRAGVVVVEGMNHVLKMVDGDLAAQMPSYGDPSLPLSPVLTDAILEFVTRLPD